MLLRLLAIIMLGSLSPKRVVDGMSPVRAPVVVCVVPLLRSVLRPNTTLVLEPDSRVDSSEEKPRPT